MSAPPTSRPRVSVLIAARDAAETLPATLASVARQSLAEWECVVVDDGSKDPVPRSADERVRVIRADGLGPARARNLGLEACAGELVAVLDADDLMRAARLERQVAALEAHPEWDGVGSWVRYFPREAMTDGMRRYEAWLNEPRGPEELRRDAWIEMPVGHPTLMLRRDALWAAGGWQERGWPEDWDLVLRLWHEHDARIGLLPERLVAWRRRAGSLSRSEGAFSLESFQRCRAHHLARHFLTTGDAYVLWGYGSTGRALRRALEPHGKHPSHVVEVHPRRLGNRLRGALAIPPEGLNGLRAERIVVSVAGAEARARIRARLEEMGFREGSDYVCAA